MIYQKGITLIGAIFVLVIVSLLGQYLLNVTSTQRQTSLLTLQSARAYQAASAGIEWGVERIINGSGSCNASTELSPAISNFTTTITCNSLGEYDENSIITKVYKVTSTSEYGNYGQLDYVSRQLETIVHD
ncbi:hypothetical protein A9Q78_08175 [Methylophaga sp. 41_12_T18]|nr:hypothetical protein A9Q78_08175 [Methylophaga sp. 41_12_T18]